MPNSEYHVIVNPVSSGGEAGRRWPETESKIRNALKDFSFELTHAGGDGERLAASAVHAGVKTLIVVGGDGTLSEVANGILQFAPEQRPSLAVLNYGTGGDFVRTTGAPADLSLMLEKIKMRREINIDAGRISFTNHQGLSARRHFINIAGCGLAGSVVNAVNQASKRFGAFTYFASSLSSAVTYKNPRVRISIDDGPFTTETITTLAVCNGQFFGGGHADCTGCKHHGRPAQHHNPRRLEPGTKGEILKKPLQWNNHPLLRREIVSSQNHQG